MINRNHIEPHQLIIEFCKQNVGSIMMNIVLRTLSSIFHILIPLSLGWYYEITFHKGGSKLHILDHFTDNPFKFGTFFVAFVLLLSSYTICSYLNELCSRKLNEKFTLSLRNKLVEAQLNHTISTNKQKSYGKYLLRFSGDLSTIQNIVRFAIVDFIADILFLLFLFGLAFSLSPTLLIFEIIICVLLFVAVTFLDSRIEKTTQARRDQLSINLNWITNRLANFDTIQLFNRSRLEHKRYLKKSQRLYLRGLEYARSISLMKTLPKLFFSLQLFGILALISFLNRSQQIIDPRNGIAFILLVFYARSPFNRLYKLNARWQIASVSFHKIVAIMNQPKEAYELAPYEFNDAVISVENLTFEYGHHLVFNNLNLVMHPKGITLVSGKFHKGKTTFVKLLTKQLLPNQGAIMIGDRDLNSIPTATWRKQFTLVSESTDFIGNTLFEALSYSKTMRKQIKAIQLIQEFGLDQKQTSQEILKLKLEQFTAQSSNQEKIIFKFIRSFLSDKPLVIIDDIIHQLDLENQEKMCRFLHKIKSKKTVIITSNQEIKSLQYDHHYTLL